MVKKISIADKLSKALKDAGITQTELSKRTGIKLTDINRWKKGKVKQPNMKNLQLIADALCLPPNYFFSNSDMINSGNTINGGNNNFSYNQYDVELLKEKVSKLESQVELILERLKKQ